MSYELILKCPESQTITVSTTTSPTSACPVRAIDGDDAMGDPSLSVDPFDDQHLVMGSLHGSGDNFGAPSPKSRSGQIFTTFISEDGGANWYDNPFVAPDEVGFDAYGEHPQVTIDPYGHVFVGSLYSQPGGDGNFTSVIASQKFTSISNALDNQNGAGDYHAQYIDPVYPNNRIGQMWFLFNPITDNMTMVWYEQLVEALPPPCDDHVGHTTVGDLYIVSGGTTQPEVWQESNGQPSLQTDTSCPGNPDTRTAAQRAAPARAPASSAGRLPNVAGMPAEPKSAPASSVVPQHAAAQAAAPAFNPKTPRSVIGVVWTDTSVSGDYYYQNAADAIGPCLRSTNPVLYRGFLYIGCIANPDEGPFPWHPETTLGTVELFRMHPDGGKPEYMGAAPISGANPKLGVRSDGRIALVAADAVDGTLQMRAIYGRYVNQTVGMEWGSIINLADKVTPTTPGLRVAAANVQDMIYREQSGALHLILKLILEPTGLGLATAEEVAAPRIRKSIVALDETYGLLTQLVLDIGNPLNRTDQTLLTQSDAVFNDLSDDFLQMPAGPYSHDGRPLGDEYQREYFAVADYGTVLFAEVVEVTELRAPGVPPAPAPPVPVASPAVSLAGAVAPAAGLAGAAFTVAILAANRRKALNMSKRE
ncbi:MAG: hypothetical protein AABX89_03420 [Candidatus Thermoplasmatota archaeon]